MRFDDPLPFSEGKVRFTCGPSRTEAEHPQPRFGQVGLPIGFHYTLVCSIAIHVDQGAIGLESSFSSRQINDFDKFSRLVLIDLLHEYFIGIAN